MNGALILLSTLGLLAAPAEVLVPVAEPLARVAERTLGDARGASELKALNGLLSDTVPAGTTLKLPGPDRALALSALETARNAVAQAERAGKRPQEAAAKLKEAEGYFLSAHYAEAARAADRAWKLVSAGSPQPTAFAVEVSEQGDTQVIGISGAPVRVEAEGTTRAVGPGETVRVKKGEPPPPPAPAAPPLTAPRPTAPSHEQKLTLQPVKGRLGPVLLAWEAVAGAQAYEVEVRPPAGEPLRLSVIAAQAQLAALSPGRYRWTVRALKQDARSEASVERLFELVDGSLKLEVKGSKWK
ncbi:LysM peptidoglycan-binding domain-containing protein [Myxococcaceae bacterium GXIMD 01537]